jgi:hypothetical protein
MQGVIRVDSRTAGYRVLDQHQIALDIEKSRVSTTISLMQHLRKTWGLTGRLLHSGMH